MTSTGDPDLDNRLLAFMRAAGCGVTKAGIIRQALNEFITRWAERDGEHQRRYAQNLAAIRKARGAGLRVIK